MEPVVSYNDVLRVIDFRIRELKEKGIYDETDFNKGKMDGYLILRGDIFQRKCELFRIQNKNKKGVKND